MFNNYISTDLAPSPVTHSSLQRMCHLNSEIISVTIHNLHPTLIKQTSLFIAKILSKVKERGPLTNYFQYGSFLSTSRHQGGSTAPVGKVPQAPTHILPKSHVLGYCTSYCISVSTKGLVPYVSQCFWLCPPMIRTMIRSWSASQNRDGTAHSARNMKPQSRNTRARPNAMKIST